eukprot:GGOE01057786.1.p2 GENE.GGOE01057786.1~~GGOE01057786.1.p2  ORF type:complete len:127 (-),score=5.49 GGOE01057786.1:144-524(-)
MIWRHLHKFTGNKGPRPKLYIPDFKRGIEHFCIHAGGRAVIEGVAKNLNLKPHQSEPSRRVLHDYGNTSSSSIWYELDYIRRHSSLQRGHRVLQWRLAPVSSATAWCGCACNSRRGGNWSWCLAGQ